jgi:hypothetical protein
VINVRDHGARHDLRRGRRGDADERGCRARGGARARAAAGGRSFTDDAAAVIAAGQRIRMVPGERRNIKITTMEDLGYARELVAKGLVAVAATVASPDALARGGSDG